MARKRSKADLFREVTWDDLREWAGSTIVSRGRGYQRNSQVEGLVRTPSGGVIAWVHGAKRYTTWVDFEEGALASACSCPYGATCKHAVAVVLEYLDHLKKGIEAPQATEQDSRMALLQESFEEEAWDEEDEEGVKDAGQLAAQQPGKGAAESLKAFLKEQTKAQLVALIEDLAEHYPAVRETLQDLHDLSRGTLKRIVTALRREIHELSAEPGWRNH
ncbi:MAG: SWIM zinc finger domain-containing protein [Thermodesulfobacteriota bacterium]